MPPTIDYPALVDLLRRAYSGERAAAFAYIGHAGSLRRKETERDAVRQIEEEEWEHRRQVKQLMDLYEIAPSRWYELKFYLIGKVVGLSCYFIGRFMPYFWRVAV
jgi:demethoxyubiquinone hydroxylase (CLK1/Coq7/Cat5 family)